MSKIGECKKCLSGRTVVLVDIANAARDPLPTEHVIKDVQVLVSDVVRDKKAQYLVATGPGSFVDVVLYWEGGRKYQRAGKDGADRALVEIAENELLISRFTELVVVSGDHFFTDYVSAFGKNGRTTTVIAWRDTLSPKLELAAQNIVFFDDCFNSPDQEFGGLQVA